MRFVLTNYIVVGFTLTQQHHKGHVCEVGLVKPLYLLRFFRIAFFTQHQKIVKLGTLQVKFENILQGLFWAAQGVFQSSKKVKNAKISYAAFDCLNFTHFLHYYLVHWHSLPITYIQVAFRLLSHTLNKFIKRSQYRWHNNLH